MKKFFLLISILISHNVFSLELAKYPIELKSNDGINAIIAPTADNKQALVKVTGINHNIDDVVFLTELKPHGSNKAYKYTYDGSQRALINVADGYRCCSYTLYIPNTRQSIYLTKNEKTNPVIVEDLLAQYQQQLNAGVQAKLAAFDREKHLDMQKQTIEKASNEILTQCDTKVITNVNWSAISDADLNKYAVGAFCSQVVKEMAYQCESNSDFKAQAAKFTTVNCEFNDELKLRANHESLEFKTSPQAPNQREFIRSYLLNL
ncbi:hypothetical protein J8L70_12175 [Pseudoalteromonas sp. MMG010]|uniref:hypothetical protein n=1 Tax=Pseudoalteromonas sp. MMG010 TaxID=2822685 RepID=UPI001B39D591|nr:hypothetical protein [Pseudoalteromonas sp. MMG010]MBQ4834001.1 hypothetical protein [Pseudoalteromonas sp. MMG010]